MKKLMMRWHNLILILVSMLVSHIAFAAQSLDSVVAIVNNEVITTTQLDQQLATTRQQLQATGQPVPDAGTLRKQVLDKLINTSLQLQVAKKINLTVDDSQVDQSIAQIAARNNMTVAQLQQAVAHQGMSYSAYRDQIKTEMTLSQLQQRELGGSINITDQDITDMEQAIKQHRLPVSNTNTATNPHAGYHIVDILAAPLPENPTAAQVKQAQDAANQLLAKLHQGADINKLMQTNSSIQLNDLGWRTLSQLPDIFATPAKALAPRQFSAPIQAPNGLHILLLAGTVGVAPSQNNMLLNPGAIPQTEVHLILVKKNPLLSDADMKSRMQLLRTEIIESNDFAKVASNNSQDAATASKGGDAGWVSPGTYPPQVDVAISQLKVGELSQPIITSDGSAYLIQVTGRREMNSSPQDILQMQAKQLVYQQKFNDAVAHWLQLLRSESYIKIY